MTVASYNPEVVLPQRATAAAYSDELLLLVTEDDPQERSDDGPDLDRDSGGASVGLTGGDGRSADSTSGTCSAWPWDRLDLVVA